MPLDVESLKELKSLLGKARKATLNFGLALARNPADIALVMHWQRDKEILFKMARKAEGVDQSKSCFGTASVDGVVLVLACESEPPPGAKKKCMDFFRDNKISMKVRILAPGGEEIEPDDGGDPHAEERQKWQEIAAKVQPKLIATLKAGKGDLQKMKAAWGLANEKAGDNEFDVAKRLLASLLKLMSQAGEERKTEAEKGSGHVVSDTATGKELLDELKAKVDQIKVAFALLPGRVAEGRQMIADVQQGVKDLDLDIARVAMTRIDMLLRDAEPIVAARRDFKMAQGRILSRAGPMAGLAPDHPEFGDMVKAYRDATAAAMAKSDAGDWLAAKDALVVWARALTTLEKAYGQNLDVEGQYKMVEVELTKRAEPLRDFSVDGFGMGDILKSYQAAVLGATDLAAKSDWAGALAKVAEWRKQLEIAEAAQAKYTTDKRRSRTPIPRLKPTLRR